MTQDHYRHEAEEVIKEKEAKLHRLGRASDARELEFLRTYSHGIQVTNPTYTQLDQVPSNHKYYAKMSYTQQRDFWLRRMNINVFASFLAPFQSVLHYQ
jgi:hypothetical protein